MALKIENLLVVENTNKLYLFLSQNGNNVVCRDLVNNKTVCFQRNKIMMVKDIFIYKMNEETITLDKVFDLLSFYYEQKTMPTLAELKSDRVIKVSENIMQKEKFAICLETFLAIIPDYDQDKFLPVHMVKILRWFIHLDEILNTIGL